MTAASPDSVADIIESTIHSKPSLAPLGQAVKTDLIDGLFTVCFSERDHIFREIVDTYDNKTLICAAIKRVTGRPGRVEIKSIPWEYPPEPKKPKPESRIAKEWELVENASEPEVVGGISVATANQLRRDLVAVLKALPYDDYVRTDHWRTQSRRAINRAGNACTLGCPNKDRTRLEAHHKSYKRRGDELPEDLIVLCEKCHRKYHSKRKKPKK